MKTMWIYGEKTKLLRKFWREKELMLVAAQLQPSSQWISIKYVSSDLVVRLQSDKSNHWNRCRKSNSATNEVQQAFGRCSVNVPNSTSFYKWIYFLIAFGIATLFFRFDFIKMKLMFYAGAGKRKMQENCLWRTQYNRGFINIVGGSICF